MKKRIITVLTFILYFNISFATNYVWTQKSNFPDGLRGAPKGFAINGKAYVTTGLKTTVLAANDLWQWDQATNLWTQKANLPGSARFSATTFKIGNKGYITCGWTQPPSSQLNDLWEYATTTNTWTQKANFSGSARYTASAFVIGNYAYVGMGYSPIKNDLWRYDPSANSWTQMANLPSAARQNAAGFAIGSYGYIACGNSGVNLQELWRYDPAGNSWTARANFPGAARFGCASFAFNNLGFVGAGTNGSIAYGDFFSYDPAANSWTPEASLPATTRANMASFNLNGKGYVCCGVTAANTYLSDFWEFGPSGPVVVVTSQHVLCNGMANGAIAASATGGTPPYQYNWSTGATTSSIGGLTAGAYTVTVTDNQGISATAVAVITQPAAIQVLLPGTLNICKGSSVTITSSVTGGIGPYTFNWTPGPFAGPLYTVSPATTTTYTLLVTDANGCTGTGSVQVKVVNPPSAPITVANGGFACYPGSVMLSTTASPYLSYQWKKNGVVIPGATSAVYYATATGTYKVIVTNLTGCSKASNNAGVTVQQLAGYITPSGSVTVCNGSPFTMVANPLNGYNYQWKRNGNNIAGATSSVYIASQSGNYKVLITDPVTGCSLLTPATVVTYINCRMGAGRDIVYPNPSAGDFTFDFSGLEEGPIALDIVDLSGKLVSQFNDLSRSSGLTFGRELEPGIYFVNVKQHGATTTYRIIKTN